MAALYFLLLTISITISGLVSANIEFVVSPSSRAVLAGNDVRLDCVAQAEGGPPLEYTWEYNGSPSALPLLPNNSLYIARIEQHQLGSYQCLVSINGQADSTVSSKIATIVEAYLEPFLIHPTSINLNQGNQTAFECVSGKSAPPPNVYWQKDGERFTEGNIEIGTFGEVGEGGAVQISSRLVFTVTLTMAGMYRCVAENSLTKATEYSDGANLTITVLPEAPTIVSQPEADIIAPATLPLRLECGVKGNPYPTVSWYRDGRYLVDSTRLSTLENGTLLITSLLEEDQGVYFCQAQNDIGQSQSHNINVTVAVLDIPFVLNPSDVHVLAGREVTLQCLPPRSVPPASTVWYKDTLPFNERRGEFEAGRLDNGALFFRNIQIEDEGQYFCVAVNDYSVPRTRTSTKAGVTVEASPVIVEPPVPTRVVLGDLLTLKCRAKARPAPQLTWSKDGEEIREGGRVGIQDSGMELLVRDVIKDDEGSYTCTVSNNHGFVTSAPALAFIIVPPEIIISPQDANVRAGADVLVPCQVYGDPRPTVIWYKDGKELLAGGDVVVTKEGVTIQSVRGEDEGTYTCKASNEAGTKEAEALLRIEVVPELIRFPEDQSIVEGQPLVLYCDGEAFPAPIYYWKFNGSRSLSREMKVTDSGRRLEITSVTRNQTGEYLCVAENDAGVDTMTATILVHVPPIIRSIIGDADLEQGQNLKLICDVDGVPTPVIDWYVDDKRIRPTLDARITFPEYNSVLIKFARRDNSGVYKCIAINEAGRVEKSLEVFVRETPFPPSLVSVRPVSMTSVNLTWEPAIQDPNNDVEAWHIQYKQSISAVYILYKGDIAAHLTSYEVSGLSAYTEYLFRVAAKNAVGVGRYSESFSARTLETAPSAPRNLQMLSHNASSISLRWEIPAQTNGEIRAYQVHYRKTHSREDYSVVSTPSLGKILLHYNLSNLEPYTTYSVKVRGATVESDEHLWGDFSNILNITTSSTPPSQAPQDIKISVTSPSSILVSWTPIPLEFHRGSLHGYVVQYRRHDNSDRRYTNVTTIATGRSLLLISLLPWREYDIRVRGYNIKGYGIPSNDVTVRTTPEVPTGYPVDIKATALSSSAVTVSWQPVPTEERNSAISGYIVEYRAVDSPGADTLSRDVGDPSVTTINITGLLPYLEYDIWMHAFTTQVVNGFGPTSPAVRVRTAEGAPGPITNLLTNVTSTSVYLTWDPPLQPNGIIGDYYVIYSLISPSPAVGERGSRLRRAVGVLVSNNTWEVSTNETEVTVTELLPERSYSFHVVAETGGGRGSIPSVPMATIDVPSSPSTTTMTPVPTRPIVDVTTLSVLMSTRVLASTTSESPGEEEQDYLPIIIGASVGGAVVLAILAGVIAILCYLRSNKKATYFITPPPEFSGQVTGSLNGQPPRASKNSSNGTISISSNATGVTSVNGPSTLTNTQSTRTPSHTVQSSISLREAVPGFSSTSHTSRPRSEVVTNSSQFGRSIPLDPLHDYSYSSMDDLRHSTFPPLHLQGAHYMPSYAGVVNPAYEGDGSRDISSVFSPNTDSTFQRNSAVYKSQQDLYADLTLSKRRKNRMKSQTAAAIAVQKNISSSMFLDTDNLINNDSVVVYDERTAL